MYNTINREEIRRSHRWYTILAFFLVCAWLLVYKFVVWILTVYFSEMSVLCECEIVLVWSDWRRSVWGVGVWGVGVWGVGVWGVGVWGVGVWGVGVWGVGVWGVGVWGVGVKLKYKVLVWSLEHVKGLGELGYVREEEKRMEGCV